MINAISNQKELCPVSSCNAPVHIHYVLQKVFKGLEGAGLHGIIISSQFIGALYVFSIAAGGKHDHFYAAAYLLQAFKTVFARHVDIQKDNLVQFETGLWQNG
ncbi:hypothetical protein [Flavobacterium johnsoniae]|uniref:hypothetical protein n=1 Tax=Flavobacterium johnsoniae TaxID=986 RepID=UPI003F498598